jgi:hypothetical protein
MMRVRMALAIAMGFVVQLIAATTHSILRNGPALVDGIGDIIGMGTVVEAAR